MVSGSGVWGVGLGGERSILAKSYVYLGFRVYRAYTVYRVYRAYRAYRVYIGFRVTIGALGFIRGG